MLILRRGLGVKNGTQRQISFEVLEGFFDLRQLRVELPEFLGSMIAEVSFLADRLGILDVWNHRILL